MFRLMFILKSFSLLSFAALFLTGTGLAQFTGIETEVHATSAYGTTYHIYANFADPTDECMALYSIGTAEAGSVDLSVDVTTSFYQHPAGSNLGSGISGFFITLVPEIAFDSWLTIGSENSDDGPVATLGMSDAFGSFNEGDGFILNGETGGSWYVTPTSNPAAMAGDDGRVLLAQLTAADDAEGNAGHVVCDWNLQWRDANGVSENVVGLLVNTYPTGCQDVMACNYNSAATDAGTCVYVDGVCETCSGETDGTGATVDNDIDDDGVCDSDEVPGCPDTDACNYNSLASDDDGSCEFLSCLLGCTDPTACNYSTTAEYEDGSCTYATSEYDCVGNCFNDTDGDGVCDGLEIAGCTDVEACNYNVEATDDNGTCEALDACGICGGAGIHVGACDCAGNVLDECGVCGGAGIAEGACDCAGSALDECGDCGGTGILEGACDCQGTEPITGYDCDGDCLSDTDDDGVCDAFEIGGCQDPLANNYEQSATDDNGTCTYDAALPANWQVTPTPNSGILLGQVTLDALPIAAGDWVAAFTTESVCAGLAQPILNGGSAYISLPIYGDDVVTADVVEGMLEGDAFVLNLFDVSTGLTHQYHDVDGQWQLSGWTNSNGAPLSDYSDPSYEFTFSSEPYVPDCGDADACNYEVGGDVDSPSCTYPDAGYDCAGNCLLDTDTDGVCDAFEVEGCDDVTACNFDELATEDDDSCLYTDACGICGGPGAILECGCEPIPEGDCNCSGDQLDTIGVCGGDCTTDADSDGICDDQDPCIGIEDTCGVCNGPGAIYACGCADIPASDCDCNGNELDALGVCGGDCLSDSDADGVCDDEDDCIGSLDACGVCNGPGAIYTCGCTEMPQTDCDCNGNQLDVLGVCGGGCLADADTDGICDDIDPCVGTLDACGICNGSGPQFGYDCAGNCLADADDDGVCDPFEIAGCTYEEACNYMATATDEDGSCTFALPGFDCAGACLFDVDSDEVCDQDEISGCQDNAACNYDASATDPGYCDYPDTGYDCAGACLNDSDNDGVCDEFEVAGCTDGSALNFNPAATESDDSCTYLYPLPESWTVTLTPSSGLVLGYVTLEGLAVNEDDWVAAFTPSGVCAGIAHPILEDGTAYISLAVYGDDATTPDSVEGMSAGEFFTLHLIDASTGIEYDYSDASGTSELEGWVNTNGTPIPGFNNPAYEFAFELEETPACGDPLACNFQPGGSDITLCAYPEAGLDCNGDCLLDSDDDGICDQNEICGCQNAAACNYNVSATDAGYCDLR